MEKRGSCILLHITSLPSPYGIGDLGEWAYRFADFLSQAKQSTWQVLPLNPTDPEHGNSPYNSTSAFAANPLLISPELMVHDGFLTMEEIENPPDFPKDRVDFLKVIDYKENFLNIAYQRFKQTENKFEYEKFCAENSYWLDDFVLFTTLKTHFGGEVWIKWPEAVRDRNQERLQSFQTKLEDNIKREKFLQFLFFKQWFSLKRYCNRKGIKLIGDIPIYVNYGSADVWSHPQIFKLNEEKRQTCVAGVPPDYFSQNGQLWGNPVYDWEVLKKTGYSWWIRRMEHTLNLFDIVRIDHFRGLVAYWEVSAGEKTAINGKWVEAPIEDFYNTLLKNFFNLPIIAEDLGLITPDVREVMHRFELPGMKVLLFAFGEDNPRHPYLPHNYEKNCVVYTGTHDNNTIRGWFEKEATTREKKRLFSYLEGEVPVENIHWSFIRLAMMSVANTVIIPMQDILGLGEHARMNKPSTVKGNWEWRLLPEQLTSPLAEKLSEMAETYGRT